VGPLNFGTGRSVSKVACGSDYTCVILDNSKCYTFFPFRKYPLVVHAIHAMSDADMYDVLMHVWVVLALCTEHNYIQMLQGALGRIYLANW
jgi:hypothetical protein